MYSDQDISNLVARVQQLEQQVLLEPGKDISKSGLTSKNFLTRAFSVWGHFFVANLLISLALTCLFVILGLVLGVGLGDTFRNLLQTLQGNLPVP